ncbi:MAG: FAD-dependent oxidoreductase [Verrucomicrobiia bacterium]
MSTVKLTIDGREVEAKPGETLLQAARKLGIDIPTLCHLEQCAPSTSCLVCLVKCGTNGKARMVPSCATQVQPGMVVESETDEVHEARRTALELLFSDHVGDCLSPCQRLCPLGLNIPLMLRQIEGGRLEQAALAVRDALPLPAVLGRLCHHPCENGCRRGAWDQPAAIRDLERHVADASFKFPEPVLPHRKAPTGKCVLIVGAGPTGLSAAHDLLRQGHQCTLVDRHDQPGGTLRTRVDSSALPPEVLDAEIAVLKRMGLRLELGVEFGSAITLQALQLDFDATLLAVGELGHEEGAGLGVTRSATGIKVNPETFQTSVASVFAAGSAVKAIPQLVRAMAEGRAAAACISQFLRGQAISRPPKPFSSIMGRLEKPEIADFLKLANTTGRHHETCAGCASLNSGTATTESSRCLHCDCRSAGDCKLQEYAERYGVDPNRFRSERRPFEQHLQHGDIIFEPGKCILCGICVQIAEQAREPLGLTFIGRGFDVRIAAPLQRTIAEGLQKVAAECVRHCPTGALVFRSDLLPPLRH